MPYLVDIQTSFPENFYTQEQLIRGVCEAWKDKVTNLKRVETIHSNVLVKSRHLAVPLEKYFSFESFDEKNNFFIEKSTQLAKQAIEKLLEKNNISGNDIHALWSNTVTGLAIPSLDARVMNLVKLNPQLKRVPLLGLGCMAGVAGINRIADYLVGHPQEAVIFFSVELCSLTVIMEDISVANLISTGLFGDGCAAVLMVGDEHPLSKKAPLKWLDSAGVFFPDTTDVMGWKVGAKGLKIVLGKGVPDVVTDLVPQPLNDFLQKHQLSKKDIKTVFAHPGGPKVLLALEKVLELPEKSLLHSWDSLAENGNMSSVSVLDIFKRCLAQDHSSYKGQKALSVALGPAFSAEMGLFEWN